MDIMDTLDEECKQAVECYLAEQNRTLQPKYSSLGSVRCKSHPTAEKFWDYHTADIVCSDCGIVLVERVVDDVLEFGDEQKSRYRCEMEAVPVPAVSNENFLEVSERCIEDAPKISTTGPKFSQQGARQNTVDKAVRNLQKPGRAAARRLPDPAIRRAGTVLPKKKAGMVRRRK